MKTIVAYGKIYHVKSWYWEKSIAKAVAKDIKDDGEYHVILRYMVNYNYPGSKKKAWFILIRDKEYKEIKRRKR